MGGFEYPANNAYVIRLSRSLLEDFGGLFTLESLKASLSTYTAAGKYLLLEWDETIRDLTIDNSEPNKLCLFWSTIGLGYDYLIYSSANKDTDFTLLTTISSGYSSLSYCDINLASGSKHYYKIIPTKDSINYPASYTIGAVVL
jgi:hypothetical protein